MIELRKNISLLLVIGILISICNVFGYAGDLDVASAYLFSEKADCRNLKVTRAKAGGTIVDSRGGLTGWSLDTSKGEAGQKIFVDLDSNFANGVTDGTEFEITVEYYDEYNAWFTIQYDSESGTKKDNHMKYGRNTGVWTKSSFVLTDAYFGDRMTDMEGKKADFCITSYLPERMSHAGLGQNPIVIRSIEVKKIPGKNPVKVSVSTDEIGNIFTPLTTNKFKVEFLNRLKSEGEYEVTYFLKNENGSVSWSKKENVKLAPGETVVREIEGEFDRFGLYDLYIDIKNDKVSSEYKVPCSYVLQADDGLVNKHYQYNVHAGREGGIFDLGDPYIELISKSNAGGFRDAYAWDHIYRPARGFNPQEHFYNINNATKKRFGEQNENIIYLGLGNGSVTGGDHMTIPTTEYHYEEWEKYVRYVLEFSGAKKFELWNEPNLWEHNKQPEQYVELARRTVKIIKEYNPEFKVGIGCLANPADKYNTHVFFDNLIKNGIFDIDFDAITLHPYSIEPEYHIDTVEYYKEIAEKNGRPDMEFWITEYGYNNGFRGGVTYREAANILTREYLSLNVRGLAHEVTAYELIEHKAQNRYNDENSFGVVSGPLAETNESGVAASAKPAYVAIAAMNYAMRDAEKIGAVEFEDKDIYVAHYKKTKTNEEMLAIWSAGANKIVTLDLGCEKIKLYDIWGNCREICGENGVFTISVTDQVKYITGNLKKVEAVKNTYNVSNITQTGVINDRVTFSITAENSENKSIDLDLPNNIKLSNTPVFVNGGADIELELPEETFEETYFTVYITEDGKRIQAIDLYVSCEGDIAEISVGKKIKNPENPKNWTAVIKVHNNSKNNILRGKIKFNLPVDFEKLAAVATGPIGPGDTAEVPVDLPALKVLGMYTVDADIKFDNGITVSKATKMDFTAASYADTKPVIDGKLDADEWNEDVALYADDLSFSKIPDWKGINDLSFSCIVEWDEDNLYYSVKALDDIWYYNPDETEKGYIWKSDSVQFGLLYGTVNEVVLGTANRTFEELGMGMFGGDAIVYRWSTQSTHSKGVVEKSEVKIGRHNGYTHYEMKVPWSEIIPTEDRAPQVGDILGFSMLVNDNDGIGRRGWMEYASGIGTFKDSSLFTYIEFIK